MAGRRRESGRGTRHASQSYAKIRFERSGDKRADTNLPSLNDNHSRSKSIARYRAPKIDAVTFRQLMPYHDLSSATEAEIRMRRQEQLQGRIHIPIEEQSNCEHGLTTGAKREKEKIRSKQKKKALPDIMPSRSSKRRKHNSLKMAASLETDMSLTCSKAINPLDHFPAKLHRMLDTADPRIVSWRPHGRAFRVEKVKPFVAEILPKYGFKQTKITSFYRQLNLYGFSRMIKGPDGGSYYHECFLRGKPHVLKGMVRVKVKGADGARPKPNEIAKTQPNLYAMPPIDDETASSAKQSNESIIDSQLLSSEDSFGEELDIRPDLGFIGAEKDQSSGDIELPLDLHDYAIRSTNNAPLTPGRPFVLETENRCNDVTPSPISSRYIEYSPQVAYPPIYRNHSDTIEAVEYKPSPSAAIRVDDTYIGALFDGIGANPTIQEGEGRQRTIWNIIRTGEDLNDARESQDVNGAGRTGHLNQHNVDDLTALLDDWVEEV